MKGISLSVLGAVVLTGSLLFPQLAGRAAASAFSQTIALPAGWQPEGITMGPGTTIYAGSLATGAVYQADLRSGEGSVLVTAQPGRSALGMKYDARSGLLFVAGGTTGSAYVYDAQSGATVAVLQLTTSTETFINDVIITRDAVYFTDSFRPLLYRLTLLPGGRLESTPSVSEIPLSGDFSFLPGQFNANGIEATSDGRSLIVVNSAVGELYRVDPDSGVATLIDLGEMSVVNGDGILLQGLTLYVVQNFFNQISVVELDPELASGTVTRLITDSRFDVPTTIDGFGHSLYVVNARFTTPATADTTYTIERVF
jgi:sugar lactone lactonase YvrE